MATVDGHGYNYENAAGPTAVTLSTPSPVAGTSLSVTQAVSFSLTVPAPDSLAHADGARIILWAMYPDLDNKTEIIYANGAFSAAFDDTSSAAVVTNGYTFMIYRNGGWPSRPNIYVHANSDVGGTNP